MKRRADWWVWHLKPASVGIASPASVVVTALILLMTVHPAAADELRGRVVRVADGDTLTVLDANNREYRVRLNGIDAPETGQAFSQASKTNLSTLVSGQDVLVVWSKIDRYGRLIGTVTRGSVNANLDQLEKGLAWYYRQYAPDVPSNLRPLYELAEADARASRRGLWQDPRPVEPWTYRQEPAAQRLASGLSGGAATGGAAAALEVRGNRSSGVYHLPNCRDYDRVAEDNRVIFKTEEAAVAAGFRKAGSCN